MPLNPSRMSKNRPVVFYLHTDYDNHTGVDGDSVCLPTATPNSPFSIACWDANSTLAQASLLYGRRRLGKTTLLRHWAEASGVPFTHWVAEIAPAGVQRRTLYAQLLGLIWLRGSTTRQRLIPW
jgi:hypothetical protein